MSIQRQALPSAGLTNEQCATLFQDFLTYTTAVQEFTSYTLGGAGTNAWSGLPIDPNSGQSDTVLSTTAATALDVAGIYQTHPNILPTSTEGGFYAEGYIYSEGVHAAGTAIQYFGLSSAHVLATTVTAADPTASYSGAIIYKLSGDTNWRTQVSNATTKKTTVSANAPIVEGANKFRIDIIHFNSASCQVTFKVNNVILVDANGIQIQSTILYASLVAMGLVSLFESDANAAAQTGQTDYLASGRFRCMLNG